MRTSRDTSSAATIEPQQVQEDMTEALETAVRACRDLVGKFIDRTYNGPITPSPANWAPTVRALDSLLELHHETGRHFGADLSRATYEGARAIIGTCKALDGMNEAGAMGGIELPPDSMTAACRIHTDLLKLLRTHLNGFLEKPSLSS